MIFTIPAKDKNSVKIIIGDELASPSEFLPSIKLSRWEGEVSLKAGFDVSAIPKASRTFSNLGNNNYQLTTPLLNFKIYPLAAGPGMEDGGLEFEIVLKVKPPTNKIILPIETTGLEFYYQPPLNEEWFPGDLGGRIATVTAIEARDSSGNIVAERPENVVGSYAVYYRNHPANYKGGKVYKTGKVCHIFRPQVIDVAGKKAWGELAVDIVNHRLTVTIPQSFLDAAVYPVRHAVGLTIGYTTQGESNSQFQGFILACRYPSAGAGDANPGTMYVCADGSGTGRTIAAGVYEDNAGTVDGAAQLSNDITIDIPGTKGLGSAAITWTGILASTDYWLAISCPATTCRIYYDATPGYHDNEYKARTYDGTMPDVFPSTLSTGARECTFYVEYTAGGATYNESVTFSSAPAISNSPQVDFFPALGAFVSTPTLTPAAIADLLGNIELTSAPVLTASVLADFLASVTFSSSPSAVAAAVADLLAGLTLSSDPALAAVGGSDFYNSIALSSDPAFSSMAFKDAFGELSLLSSPAFAASALADLYVAITMASAAGISLTALADLFAGLSLSSNPALAALGTIGGGIITSIGAKRAAAGLSNRAPAGLKRTAGAGLRRDA